MTKETASSIIKLAAIFVVFLGLVFISVVFIQIQSMNNMFQEMSGQMEMFSSAFSSLGWHGYTAPTVMIVWGILLYALNRPLSLLVAES